VLTYDDPLIVANISVMGVVSHSLPLHNDSFPNEPPWIRVNIARISTSAFAVEVGILNVIKRITHQPTRRIII